jgi:hypothetical protein
MTYDIENLSEEEVSLIICALYREIHLVQSEKHYKTAILKRLIEKIGVPRGVGKHSKLV